jgi:hypothetical protein
VEAVVEKIWNQPGPHLGYGEVTDLIVSSPRMMSFFSIE